ncbi:MAG: hypothetical protein RMJ97_05405 [Raineya sp.]|nr:hypothetical protein [Raineya sp.]
MNTEIRKAIQKKFKKLLKKYKKIQVSWSTADYFFDIQIQTPKSRNILLPYAYYVYIQQKIFQIIDFPSYALVEIASFKSAGVGKLTLNKANQIIFKCKYATNCGKLNLENITQEELEKTTYYFDFEDKFNLIKYNKNFDIELWIDYSYLFETGLHSTEILVKPKNENATRIPQISQKAQNYWIENVKTLINNLLKHDKFELFTPPTLKKVMKYRFPKKSFSEPFLFGIKISSKILKKNQVSITIHRDFEYINFARKCLVLFE